MKNPLLGWWLLGFVSLVSAARASGDVVLQTLRGEIPAGIRAVQVDNQLGNVAVTAAADGFGWEWKLHTSDDRNGRASDYAQECRLDVQEVDGVLRLVVIRPENEQSKLMRRGGALRGFLSVVTLGAVSNHESSVQSDLVLKVPATNGVEVKNRFGGVKVAGTRGAVGVDCRNGTLELSDLEGAVTARTSFASLRARKIGPAQLTNQNGSIDAADVTGDLNATTSFAKIQLRDVKGHAVVKNQNGAIDALRVTGDLAASTSFGDLRAESVGGKAELKGQNSRVEVIGVTGPVKATTSFGTLRLVGLGAGAELKNQNGAIDARRVTGDLVAATSFAGLHVEEIGGRATLDCRNGKIEAEHVTGGVQAENSFAPLHVRQVGGAVELRGQNSDIVVSGASGDVDARTSFGRLQIDGSGRRFVARNQNGAVEIVARSPEVERVEASATFAAIDLRLPKEAKPFIRATTSFGKVHSEFPVLMADTVSEARFAADTSPLKVVLKGQNGDIRIHSVAAR